MAIANAISAGISVVVAAGNDNLDACSSSPAGSKGVIAVAATDRNDNKASFSNYGSCIGLFAPGSDIFSAAPGNSYATKKGTSQASPFVVGVAALYLETNPTAVPADVLSALQTASSKGVVQNVQGSPNYLLQSVSIPAPGSDAEKSVLVQLTPPSQILTRLSIPNEVLLIIGLSCLALAVIVSAVVIIRYKARYAKGEITNNGAGISQDRGRNRLPPLYARKSLANISPITNSQFFPEPITAPHPVYARRESALFPVYVKDESVYIHPIDPNFKPQVPPKPPVRSKADNVNILRKSMSSSSRRM